MSGGSAVKTAVGMRGITRFGSDHRERKTGKRPTAPAGLGLDGQGAAGPALKEKEDQPKAGRVNLTRGIVTEWPRRAAARGET